MGITINSKNVSHFKIYREPEKAYIELNKIRPSFTKSEIERGLEESFEEYSELEMGCFGTAFACISYESFISVNNKRPNKTINPFGISQ